MSIQELRSELRRLHAQRNGCCTVPERCKAAIESQRLGHALTDALVQLNAEAKR